MFRQVLAQKVLNLEYCANFVFNVNKCACDDERTTKSFLFDD